MPRYLLVDSMYINSQWHDFLMPIDEPDDFILKRQIRSRGKHDPGSGPYINRIVYGGHGEGVSQQGNHCYAGGFITASEFGIPEDRGWWGRVMRFRYQSWGAVYRDPWGSHPTNPKYEHWYVRFYRVQYTNVSVYGRYCDYDYSPISYYDVYSYFGSFPDSFEGARSFLLKQLWGPTSEYPMRAATGHVNRDWTFSAVVSAFVEPQFSSSIGDLGSADTDLDTAPPGLQAGLASAYIDACDKLPHLKSMNNIANAIQTATLLRDLLHGEVTELGKLKDAWLGWRYEYSTTKMDIEEAAELTDRILDLTKFVGSKYLRSNGFFRSGSWTFRASLGVQFDVLSELQSFAEKYGVELNGYNVWDMLPYSFVVDWFLHISDILERWESQKYALKVPVTMCWLSAQCDWVNEFGCHEIFYRRYSGRPNIRVADLDRLSYGPSAVTVVKRAVDVVCLL